MCGNDVSGSTVTLCAMIAGQAPVPGNLVVGARGSTCVFVFVEAEPWRLC